MVANWYLHWANMKKIREEDFPAFLVRLVVYLNAEVIIVSRSKVLWVAHYEFNAFTNLMRYNTLN
jgi:hypothetical protein